MKTKAVRSGAGTFQQFIKRREAASRAYVQGEPAPLGKLVSRRGAATFFGPGGGTVRGAGKVWSRYKRDSGNFESDSTSTLKALQQDAGGEIGYWVGIQNAVAHLRGKKARIPMKLRITEIFRRENREWKLIHRHADPLVNPPSGPKK